jgi:hypothetical protein
MSMQVTVTLDGDSLVAVKRATSDSVERLRAEAFRLRRAGHPGVVAVVGQGPVPGGEELRLRYAGEPLDGWQGTLAEVAGLGAAVAATLADLHDLGLVHGRVDTSHVLVGPDGRPRLCGLSDPGAATAADDVLAVGQLVEALAERVAEARRGPFGRPGADRRALARVAARATDPEPSRRPSARTLSTSMLAAVQGAHLPAPAPPHGPPGVTPAAAADGPGTTGPVTGAVTGAGAAAAAAAGTGIGIEAIGDAVASAAAPLSPARPPHLHELWDTLEHTRLTSDATWAFGAGHIDGADLPATSPARPANADAPPDLPVPAGPAGPPAGPEGPPAQPGGPPAGAAAGSATGGGEPAGSDAAGDRSPGDVRAPDDPADHHRPLDDAASNDPAPRNPAGNHPARDAANDDRENDDPAEGGEAEDESALDAWLAWSATAGLERPLPRPEAASPRGRRRSGPGRRRTTGPVPLPRLGDAPRGDRAAAGEPAAVAVPPGWGDEPPFAAVDGPGALGETRDWAPRGRPPAGKGPADPAGPTRPRAGVAIAVALVVTAGLAAGSLVRPGERGPAPDERTGACPATARPAADVDGDGCPEELAVEGNRVSAGGNTWELGRPGDVVVVGDWDCDGSASSAVLRPTTGDVFVFAGWADAQPVTVTPARSVPGGVGLRVDRAGGCDALVVETAGGADAVVEEARA